jgi:hypothetical protein
LVAWGAERSIDSLLPNVSHLLDVIQPAAANYAQFRHQMPPLFRSIVGWYTVTL